MKKSELLNLVISYIGKNISIDSACRSGRTAESKFFEFKGESPQLSNFKVETVSTRAARIVGIVIKKEEKLAYRAFMKIPKRAREVVLIYSLACKQHNPKTGKPFTHEDCAEELGISLESYRKIRSSSLEIMKIYFQTWSIA